MHCVGHRQIPATFTSSAHRAQGAGRGPVAYGHSPLVARLSFHTDKRGRPLSRIRWPLKVLCICHLAVASLAISSFAFSDISHTILCGLVILLWWLCCYGRQLFVWHGCGPSCRHIPMMNTESWFMKDDWTRSLLRPLLACLDTERGDQLSEN